MEPSPGRRRDCRRTRRGLRGRRRTGVVTPTNTRRRRDPRCRGRARGPGRGTRRTTTRSDSSHGALREADSGESSCSGFRGAGPACLPSSNRSTDALVGRTSRSSARPCSRPLLHVKDLTTPRMGHMASIEARVPKAGSSAHAAAKVAAHVAHSRRPNTSGGASPIPPDHREQIGEVVGPRSCYPRGTHRPHRDVGQESGLAPPRWSRTRPNWTSPSRVPSAYLSSGSAGSRPKALRPQVRGDDRRDVHVPIRDVLKSKMPPGASFRT